MSLFSEDDCKGDAIMAFRHSRSVRGSSSLSVWYKSLGL